MVANPSLTRLWKGCPSSAHSTQSENKPRVSAPAARTVMSLARRAAADLVEVQQQGHTRRFVPSGCFGSRENCEALSVGSEVINREPCAAENPGRGPKPR